MKSGIVFDLDGTLYDARGVNEENRSAALQAVSEFFSMPLEKAGVLIQEMQDLDDVASISRAVSMLGVPSSIFAGHQLRLINPELHIKEDPDLVSLVEEARRKYRLALYTNTRREFVPRIIRCIGFPLDAFDIVVAGGDVKDPKPSVLELRKVVEQLGILPVDCFAVGDRWTVDLEPATKIGMTPVHVRSRDELVEWLRSII